ncbi:MAG TPA: aminotransferase class V-fold PLP-dependent enzyme [Terriglobia bacterium]|nr:aminotransferase class V-fold PLP-dependent enzyme [Terriglobia bacterium]
MPNRRNFLAALATSPFLRGRGGPAPAGPSPRPGLADWTGAPSLDVPPWPAGSDAEFWDRIRDQFYITPGEAYFNTGTLGATPRPVLERVIDEMRVLQQTITRWDYTAETPNWISGYSPEVPLRQKLGKLVNASAEELAITQNATFGMNFLAHGIDLKPGDEVVTTDQEHPGGVCGWQERVKRDGAVWTQVKIPVPANDPDELVHLFEAAITPRTRVIAVPHIISGTAVVMPVKRISQLAREHHALAIVDGAQAVGQVAVDLKDIGCDAYYSSPHKWLLAPAGNGMLYIRRDRQDSFWTTLCSAEWDNHKDGMYRFMQYGTGNPALQAGLDAALDFHFRIGPERVRARIRSLADRLRAGLKQIPGVKINSPVHPELAGAVAVYSLEGVPAAKLEDELWTRRHLRPRSVGDPLGIRHSCQIYNSEAEIDSTLEVVRDVAAKRA